jgi:hypothetical protein
MQSVDQPLYHAFALARFNETKSAVYQSYLELFRKNDQDGGDSRTETRIMSIGLGIIIERRCFLEIGKTLGYFDPSATMEQPAVDISDFARFIRDNDTWPDWFKTAAVNLSSRSSAYNFPEMPSGPNPHLTPLFQTAMILAEEFNEPSILYLQKAVQEKQSCLDTEALSVSNDDVWAELRDDAEWEFSPPEKPTEANRCVAGFLQLVEVLAAFDNVFSCSNTEKDERDRLIRTISLLLAWRLNLHNKQTENRINTVSEMVWTLCANEFKAHPDTGVDWSPERSRELLATLLSNWKSRSDGEEKRT